MTVTVDVRPSGIQSGVVAAPFDKAYDELTATGYDVISLAQNVDLRLAQGRDSEVTRNGNYVLNGQVYRKGEKGVFVAVSPLITNAALRTQAVEANRNGRYLDTQDGVLYDEVRRLVDEDASRDPHDRRAMLLPADKAFPLSPQKNPELFAMALGKNGAAYLDMIGQDSVTFYPIEQGTLKDYAASVPTQLWFRGHGGVVQSELFGNFRGLDCGDRVRGVRNVSVAEGHAREGSVGTQNSELYTSAQVRNALRELLPGLEAQLFERLQGK
ncbi:MAG: hypothetical protein AABX53_03870 [Nanoarchaeota archaeon]